ncbi:MAG: D-sedoheptulose 7-phosphate isomerase [Candidatus Eremiobacteraeota bacterium]|nr:D-sedoheptulose 7-phosphate isomerase [Candidatus Eremiobacteraeota bacterium]
MTPGSRQNTILASLQESIDVKKALLEQSDLIEAMGQVWCQTLAQGGTIYFVGNGGSAADAQHLAAELVGRFERENGYPAVALTTDTSLLTALANDFTFDEIFSRQVKAMCRKGDLLVAISTSGNSPNVVKAAEQALAQGCQVMGLAGGKGGRLAELCQQCLVVASRRTCRIQEAHITVGHILCELVEATLPVPGVAPQCA